MNSETETDITIREPTELIHDNDDETVILPTQESDTNRKKVFISIEPVVLLIFFAINLTNAVFVNQVIFQTCTTVFHFNSSECAKLGTSELTDSSQHIEKMVQPFAAEIFMTSTLLQSIIPAVLNLFLGSWSDQFGRKPILLSSFIGYFSFYFITTIIAYLSTKYTINPWVYILGAIAVSLSGGTCALITGIFCYISDLTTIKNRAYKMLVIEACIYIGLLCGSLPSSYILAATNTVCVFLISTITMLIAVIYTIFFVKESLNENHVNHTDSKIQGLFQWILVKDMFKTCFEKRPNCDRAIIWLTVSVLGLSVFVMEGNSTVFYLFVREKFEWTIKDYSFYDAANIIIQIFGNIIIGYILQKLFKLSVTSMALLALGSNVMDSVIKLTALYPWHLYLSIFAGFLKGLGGPMCRSILSNVIPLSDAGKIQSLATSIETISPLASAPLYTYVYNLTLQSYPAAFFSISTITYFICYIFLAIIYGIQKSFPTQTYEAIGN